VPAPTTTTDPSATFWRRREIEEPQVRAVPKGHTVTLFIFTLS